MKNVRRGWMELRINLALLKVIVAPAVVNWTNFYFVCTKFSAICSPKHRERDYLLCCYSVLVWGQYLPKILVDWRQTLGLSDTGQTWWQFSSWTSLVKCRGRIICLKLHERSDSSKLNELFTNSLHDVSHRPTLSFSLETPAWCEP